MTNFGKFQQNCQQKPISLSRQEEERTIVILSFLYGRSVDPSKIFVSELTYQQAATDTSHRGGELGVQSIYAVVLAAVAALVKP